MWGYFFSIVDISILTLEFAIIAQLFLKTTQIPTKRYMAYMIMGILSVITSRYYEDILVLRYCGEISAMIILIIMLEGPILKRLSVIFGVVLLNLVLEIPLSLLMLKIIKSSEELVLIDEACIRITVLLIIMVLSLILEQFLANNIKRWIVRKWGIGEILIKLGFMLLCIIVTYVALINLTNKLGGQELLTCYYIVMVLVILGITIWEAQLKRKNIRTLEKLRKRYTTQEILFYQRIERLQALSDVNKREAAQQIEQMQNLLENGQIEAVSAFADQVVEHIKDPIKTGSNLIDAIVMQKCEEANNKGIVTKVNINIPNHIKIPTVDLCTLIAGGIDYGINQISVRGSILEIEGTWSKGYIIFKLKVTSNKQVHAKQKIFSKKEEEGKILLEMLKKHIVKYNGKLELQSTEEGQLTTLSFYASN